MRYHHIDSQMTVHVEQSYEAREILLERRRKKQRIAILRQMAIKQRRDVARCVAALAGGE